jgi:hypothetical protein
VAFAPEVFLADGGDCIGLGRGIFDLGLRSRLGRVIALREVVQRIGSRFARARQGERRPGRF